MFPIIGLPSKEILDTDTSVIQSLHRGNQYSWDKAHLPIAQQKDNVADEHNIDSLRFANDVQDWNLLCISYIRNLLLRLPNLAIKNTTSQINTTYIHINQIAVTIAPPISNRYLHMFSISDFSIRNHHIKSHTQQKHCSTDI